MSLESTQPRPSRPLPRVASGRLTAAIVLAAVCAGADTITPAGRLVVEAEHCQEMTYPWQPAEARGASGGLSLTLPEGAGSSEAFELANGGRAWFDLAAPDVGQCELWLRVLWHGNCSNSLYASLEPSGFRDPGVHSQKMQHWHWVKALSADLDTASRTLVLGNREDGIWVDQICLQPEGAPEPQGVLSADSRWLEPEPSTPSVTQVLSAGHAGVEPLPPTDFLLHHKRGRRQALPRMPTLVVTPGRRASLDLWLRINRTQGLPVHCALETSAPVTVEPEGELTVHSSSDPLCRREFTVRAHPDMRRGLSVMRCRLRTADGFEHVKSVMLLRPYRWQVSQALRFNPKAGIGQRASRDAAVLATGAEKGAGIRWSRVQPDQITPFGLVDLRAAVSPKTYAMAYATADVDWPRNETVYLDVLHDDWMRVWLNGQEVFSSEVAAPATLTRQLLRVNVKKGKNRLLVKCCQLKNYWEFSAILREIDSVREPVNTWEVDN